MVQPKKKNTQYNPSHQQTEKGTPEGSGSYSSGLTIPHHTALGLSKPIWSHRKRKQQPSSGSMSPLNRAELGIDGSRGPGPGTGAQQPEGLQAQLWAGTEARGRLQRLQVSVVYWGAPLLSPHTHQGRHTKASISVTHISREGSGRVRETEFVIQTAPLQRTTTRRKTSSQQHESQEQNLRDKWTKREVDTCVCSVAQSCPTLCDPRDCSPPGSSVHGLLQARILEWVAMPSSRGSSQPRD